MIDSCSWDGSVVRPATSSSTAASLTLIPRPPLAKRMNIPNRSKMNKQQLQRAVDARK